MAKLKFLLAASLFAAALPAAADDLKVGYVDTQRIIREAPAAITAARKLEQDFGRRDQDLRRLAADLQSRQQALEKDGITLSESDRRARERELGDLGRELQRKQREFKEDFSQRQNEENMALIERASHAIEQLAKAEQFDLILQDALWAGPGIDITDRVIKALSAGK